MRVALLHTFAASKKEPLVATLGRVRQAFHHSGLGEPAIRFNFRVWGLGFKASLILPVCAHAAIGAQYPIGDADQWQKIVENLGALVAELERYFVPEIEKAAGPSPEWYHPKT